MTVRITYFIISLILCYNAYSQDEILFINGGRQYVDRIDTINGSFLYYLLDSNETSLPVQLISGYYVTIKTRRNLSKKFSKRQRVYYDIGNEDESRIFNIDFSNEFINSRIPKNLATLDYSKGYYVTKKGDTVNCKFARLPPSDQALFCITRNHNDQYTILTADKINFYSTENKIFKSFSLKNIDGNLIHQFIEGIVIGTINYYEKISTPINSYGFGIVYKENSKKIYPHFKPGQTMISFEKDKYRLSFNMDIYGNIQGLTSIPENLNTNYTGIMYSLISDCPAVKYKFNEGFYTEGDLIPLLTEYNSCNFLDK